jgi:S-adenosylmethionine-diacylgycerolhomoserine-N-methlytransferase
MQLHHADAPAYDVPVSTALAPSQGAELDACSAMDRIYRHQRHFYDFTRPLFLFGRDTLLRRMDVRENDRVLEVGCGTARNLLKLHGLRRAARLYGLDASQEMLATARWNVRRRGLERSVRLEHGLAQELCHARTFGLDERFDVIFFSYSLSMIPPCVRALDAALASLKPGRSLYIVDFCDQAGFPPFARAALGRWLAWFGVHHRPELHAHLDVLAAADYGALKREEFGARYGVLAEFRKA